MQEKEDKPAEVELRSDKELTGKEAKEKDKKGKRMGMLLGVAALVIVIGLGTYAAMRQVGRPQPGAQQAGTTAQLPVSSPAETPISTTTSGLSGLPCEHPTRRAIGVMLAGDPINRPLSGFAEADMVWELPVLASNVTRLLAVYQCGEPKEIGSVRSARHDYLFLAQGVDAIVGHWGGSYWALNRISAGEFQTINALSNPFSAYYRKSNLPPPYNGFTSYDKLWNALQKLGYRTTTEFKGYEFKDDAPASERPAGGTLAVAWPGSFRVSYEYDPQTNRYVRYWAGTKQADPASGKVVAPSAVVVARATNQLADGPGGYNDVGIEGKGTMTVYQDGKAIPGTWEKNELEKKDPMHFYNEQHQPIVFTRGQIWVMTPSSDIAVTWTPK